jgi:DoxX.
MKTINKTMASWLSILVAVLSAVGVCFLPDFKVWFFAILLLNLVGSILFHKGYNKNALLICRLLVGALFVFSSFTKGVDPLGTKYKILDYLAVYNMEWLNGLAMMLAVKMILVEFFVGICLMTNVLPRLATLGASILMLFFTMTTLFDALFDLVSDCGCFGTAVKMSNWQTFFKNLVIDAVLIPLIFNNKKLTNKLTLRGQVVIGLIYTLLFTWFEVHNYRHLPAFDWMNWKVGKQMVHNTGEELKVYVTYRNKQNGNLQEYLSPHYPWNDSVWMSNWEFVDQRTTGGPDFLGFSALDADGNDVTEMLLTTEKLLMFTSHDMRKITEKEWAKIEEVTRNAEQKGFYVVWITSSEPEYVQSLQDKYAFLYEVYFGDELEIKTIVRYNPGLIFLDKGVVIDKWSAVDFPSAKKMDKVVSKMK